jgi:hypothetical protein
MKRMTIMIDEGLARKLAFVEKHEGISPSDFIRECARLEMRKFLKEIRLTDEMLAREERLASQEREKRSD